ncbi:MAG: histidinol-phosphate transaminase [Pyrinomonadaceae bacterium]
MLSRSDANGSEAAMTFDLERIVRKNIRNLKPYSSARSEFEGSAEMFLDANENAFGSPAGDGLNRYPDQQQTKLKQRLAVEKGLKTSQIFVGNGSDEAIDLLFRIFCEPGRDEAIICPPTYGMYRVSADINDVSVKEIRLTDDFQLDTAAILAGIGDASKLIFICSPNNPTGNLMRRESIVEIAQKFSGIVVVDEAYIHFAGEPSMIAELENIPNLVVLQTFSKAWGMAGARVGLAFGSRAIINLMNRVKPPYNVSELAQRAVLDAFENENRVKDWIEATRRERFALAETLAGFDSVETVYPSDANFLLVKVAYANETYKYLIDEKIVVRNRNNVALCEGCLRITVGTPDENKRLKEVLKKRYPAKTQETQSRTGERKFDCEH